jgi:hypothetical protein
MSTANSQATAVQHCKWKSAGIFISCKGYRGQFIYFDNRSSYYASNLLNGMKVSTSNMNVTKAKIFIFSKFKETNHRTKCHVKRANATDTQKRTYTYNHQFYRLSPSRLQV